MAEPQQFIAGNLQHFYTDAASGSSRRFRAIAWVNRTEQLPYRIFVKMRGPRVLGVRIQSQP